MKKLLLLPILLMFLACGQQNSTEEKKDPIEQSTESPSEEKELSILTDDQFGESFQNKEIKKAEDMLKIYQDLSLGDTLQVQFQSQVQSVCAKKGCWMKLDLPEDMNVHVTFKDYGFFVPKDSKGHEMVVEGRAFIEETDVETLKHYAEDAGESEEDIAAITSPEMNYRFIAEGARAVK
ncbi:hypothetical protein pgond44_09736 [Psychroflexus gondwanensis ACAM 44]|uniref:DUF4920 domain-containing protein n=1 Tax=Psychroflexus gondwanensis ACAM 44 TaxID=1189619 RepID=N1WY74_9FLAO|nr:DUF4920 domain-containing protein [Psychroflexus gondwanensis]EMY80833.1 hypothetical protein pgond44_09736 [Psychroflexus gondwanensis ACAM 44]